MALALWFACGVPCTFAQELVPTGPAAESFTLGALKISVLRDGGLAITNDGSVFGLNASPAAVATVLRAAGASPDKIRLDIDALLIRMPGHVVLVDTGYGSAGHGVLRESLASAGVSPEDVTDVLITHEHPDHVGGLLDAQGQSAFRKATIRMSAHEWAFMQGQGDTHALVTTIKAQVQTFEPGQPVLPGITPVALYGHTPGHVGYDILSEGRGLLDLGDMVHSSIVSLAKPDWTIAWDADKAEGIRMRRSELQQLAATHEIIFAPHFPFPGLGRIERTGNGFTFRPQTPSAQ